MAFVLVHILGWVDLGAQVKFFFLFVFFFDFPNVKLISPPGHVNWMIVVRASHYGTATTKHINRTRKDNHIKTAT